MPPSTQLSWQREQQCNSEHSYTAHGKATRSNSRRDGLGLMHAFCVESLVRTRRHSGMYTAGFLVLNLMFSPHAQLLEAHPGGTRVVMMIVIVQTALHAMAVNRTGHSSNDHAPEESVTTCKTVNDVHCCSIRRSKWCSGNCQLGEEQQWKEALRCRSTCEVCDEV